MAVRTIRSYQFSKPLVSKVVAHAGASEAPPSCGTIPPFGSAHTMHNVNQPRLLSA